MKKIATLILLTATISTMAWAQQASPGSSATNDQLVQMRLEIQSARKEYDRKVKEAKGVFNEAKKAAAQERDTAISAARTKGGQS
ncbi:hypothetical protein D3C87_1042420 [compost metagenome]|uniref:DUF4398 domain-containing protein n=1 Tax=Cupriavidus campinensis TaxID=151783 RepID=A0AAE9I751_9BURK|nr:MULTISPECIES: hypothetical protein [Cupriavidus]TSP09848.1 hypothetical protein FGG12_25295 [Cupriavidus campinensis]URF08033.1 hypothetical protein M5D45_23040 [Cupriavidus campinensis]CAG2128861.1 hypothetical protein LMG19282_00079 [Cupriavidus campinensis]